MHRGMKQGRDAAKAEAEDYVRDAVEYLTRESAGPIGELPLCDGGSESIKKEEQ